MSVGTYGLKNLASVSFNDVDILYTYSPTRQDVGDLQFNPLFSNITNNELRKIIGADGLYKLRLPANVFNRLGFYSVLIKPKSFEIEIVDCSFIVQNQDNEIQISKKGIVIPALQFRQTGSLIGYKIEYFDDNGNKINNLFRIITSSDLVSLASNTNSNSPASTSYNLDSNGSFLFLTLTPDELSLISNQQKVDLGKAGQKILLSNTFFDPEIIEIEMVDQTIKTLSWGIYGNSTRDLDSGVFSIFDEFGNLYKQYNLYTQKKQFSDGSIDIKEQRTSINLDQTFFNLAQGIGS